MRVPRSPARGRLTKGGDSFLMAAVIREDSNRPDTGEIRMATYEYLNLIASFGGLALIYYGIQVMAKNADMRAADSERKHVETMADIRRREEDGVRRHEESMARHDESMAALRELIERTR